MRARARLKELISEYDSVETSDSSMDAADLLSAFVQISREVVAEFDELYDTNGDQAWEIGDDEYGDIMLYNNGDIPGQWFIPAEQAPFSERGPAYNILRAIYGGEP